LKASTQNHPKASFTIVTGDLLVHHFRDQFNAAATVHDEAAFRSFVRKSIDFVTLELKQRSPGTRVIVTLGNNDDECADYAIQPNGPFLQDTAKVISDVSGITDPDSYVRFGSYNVANPAIKNHRIIVLNTVFFSARYRDACGNSNDDPGESLLSWLATNLADARSDHQKVWLVYHIPPGVDAFATTHAKQPSLGAVTLLWKEAYADKFVSLLNQYADVVGANFAGHLHVDDFRLLGESSKTAPFIVTEPAVSPITGQNPTFRLVEYDSRGTLKDQDTYFLKNLAETVNGSAPVWELEYDFAKQWKLNGLNAANYSKLYEQLGASPDDDARWMLLYSTSNLAGGSIKPGTFRQFYCAIGNISTKAYQACVAGPASAR
jgi:hypothetical protein